VKEKNIQNSFQNGKVFSTKKKEYANNILDITYIIIIVNILSINLKLLDKRKKKLNERSEIKPITILILYRHCNN
jgi:hypothetical protein